MANLIPIVKDILPIFSPGEVEVTRANELSEPTAVVGQTQGMIRKGAVVDRSDKLCSLVMLAPPHSSSAIHHHGDQDTIVYCASGHGSVISPSSSSSASPPEPAASSLPSDPATTSADPLSPPLDHPATTAASAITTTDPVSPPLKRTDLNPGDWVYIPAYAEHQEVNDSDGELVWIVVRSGRTPVTVNLEGWGGAVVES